MDNYAKVHGKGATSPQFSRWVACGSPSTVLWKLFTISMCHAKRYGGDTI